jgi:hypothetical protein
MVGGLRGNDHVFEIISEGRSQCRPEGGRNIRLGLNLIIQDLILHHLGDASIIQVIFVKGNFVPYPKPNQQSYSHSNRQTRYVDKRMGLVFTEVAQGGYKEISEHAFGFEIRRKTANKMPV